MTKFLPNLLRSKVQLSKIRGNPLYSKYIQLPLENGAILRVNTRITSRIDVTKNCSVPIENANRINYDTSNMINYDTSNIWRYNFR